MTTISPEPTAYLLRQWERFFMTGEEQFTEAEIDEWDCDIDHLIGEARVSEDAYLYALGARCERLANLWDDVQDIIDDIRTGGKQCL